MKQRIGTMTSLSSPKLIKSLAIALVICSLAGGQAYGISAKDKKAIINDTVFYDAEDATICGTSSSTSGPLVGSDNGEKIWNFFIGKGLSPNQTAGIIGNLMQESRLDPASNQNGGGPGRGIAQWEAGARWEDLKRWAAGRDPLDLGTQLDFMWYEMTEAPVYNRTLLEMKKTTTLEDAVLTFERVYERAGKPVLGARLAFAQQALATYGNVPTPDNPDGLVTTQTCAGSDGTVGDGTGGDVKPGTDTSAQTCPAGKDAGIGTVHVGQTGNTYQIRLCTVQGITVNSQIAAGLDGLMTASKAAGRRYTGYGYRTYERQQELRVANGCRDVFTTPSSQCKTPTARPGFSNHEDGLAIDFSDGGTLIRSRNTAGFSWLNANASKYGLKNFPKEAWHWSVDGT